MEKRALLSSGDYYLRRIPLRPLGGVATPANKQGMAAPYLTLIGPTGTITSAIIISRRRNANSMQSD